MELVRLGLLDFGVLIVFHLSLCFCFEKCFVFPCLSEFNIDDGVYSSVKFVDLRFIFMCCVNLGWIGIWDLGFWDLGRGNSLILGNKKTCNHVCNE